MASDLSDQLIQMTIGDKHYALIPLCTFHDIPPKQNEEYDFEVIARQFGLKNTYKLFSVYEIVDPKKVVLAKIKYGI
jgi:hypothetical protein